MARNLQPAIALRGDNGRFRYAVATNDRPHASHTKLRSSDSIRKCEGAWPHDGHDCVALTEGTLIALEGKL